MWHPIETYMGNAHGSPCVILTGTYEGRKWMEIGYWVPGKRFTNGRYTLCGATHWMPLPDFPED